MHLLQGKKDVVSPLQNDTVQGALIKLSQLLHKDTTPDLPPLPVPNITSEGASMLPPNDIVSTSEGENEISRFKTTINPIIPRQTPLHPSLYNKQTPSVPQQNIHSPINKVLSDPVKLHNNNSF